MHEAFAVQELDGLGDLQEDVEALAVLPKLWRPPLAHPVLQVLFAAQLHLDVQVHLHRMYRSAFRMEGLHRSREAVSTY